MDVVVESLLKQRVAVQCDRLVLRTTRLDLVSDLLCTDCNS
jgi:hypothetical protein